MEDKLNKPFLIVPTLSVKDNEIAAENPNEKKPPNGSELPNPSCLSLIVQAKEERRVSHKQN
jgi:hypothetical protein